MRFLFSQIEPVTALSAMLRARASQPHCTFSKKCFTARISTVICILLVPPASIVWRSTGSCTTFQVVPYTTACNLRGDAAGRYVSGHEHLQIVDRNETVSKCILQINSGRFQEADATLSAIIKKEPTCYQALVARGTCRALAGSTSHAELKKADSDFSKALVQMPLLADVWKRRSQARAALGNTDGAARDLEECLAKCAASYTGCC